MNNLKPIGMSRVPTLVELCKPHVEKTWMPKFFDFNPICAQLISNRFFKKVNLCIFDPVNFMLRSVRMTSLFHHTLILKFPLEILLNPRYSFKYFKFLDDQLILRDLASQICIFLNSGGRAGKVIHFLNSFKAFDLIPVDIREDVIKDLSEVLKAKPSEQDIPKARERLANAFKWQVYTLNNACIAKKNPQKIVEVAEHGDKKSKDATERVRPLGAKMIVDSLMLHLSHQMQVYKTIEEDVSDNDFLDAIIKAYTILAPLYKTLLLAYNQKQCQLSEETDRKYLTDLKYLEEKTAADNNNLTYPIVGYATTVLQQLLRLFFRNVNIYYRNDLTRSNNNKILAPTFIHPIILMDHPTNRKRVVVDTLYKLYLTGAKCLHQEDVIIQYEDTLPKLKERLSKGIPHYLQDNFDKLWCLDSYQGVNVNLISEVAFTEKPNEQVNYFNKHSERNKQVNDRLKQHGIEKLVKTQDSERASQELLMHVNKHIEEKGFLNVKDIDDMFEKINSLPIGLRTPFFNFIKLDARPQKLIRPEAVGYLTEIEKIINPDFSPRTLLYGGVGSDMLTPCLLGFFEAYLVDKYPINFNTMSSLLKLGAYERKLEELSIPHPELYPPDDNYPKSEIQRYAMFKFINGGVTEELFIKNHEFKILYELISLGADITNIQCEKVPEFNGVRLKFRRKHICEDDYRDYTYTFIYCDLTKPKDYPEGLKALLQKGIDVYLQKARNDLIRHYNLFIKTIVKAVKGFLLTNDVLSDSSINDVGKYAPHTVPVSPPKRMQLYMNLLKPPFIDWEYVENHTQFHFQCVYWLFVNIRKKIDPKIDKRVEG